MGGGGGWGGGGGGGGGRASKSKMRQDRVMVQGLCTSTECFLYLCIHFDFRSALLELCQRQEN